MAKKGKSLLALLTGMTVGAAAVFLSDKKNRDRVAREAKEVASKAKAAKKSAASKAKKAVKRGKKVAAKTVKKARAAVKKAARKARR